MVRSRWNIYVNLQHNRFFMLVNSVMGNYNLYYMLYNFSINKESGKYSWNINLN